MSNLLLSFESTDWTEIYPPSLSDFKRCKPADAWKRKIKAIGLKKNSNAYIRVTPSESKREMNRSRDVSPLKLRKNFLTSSFLNKTQMNAYERKKCIRLLGNQKNSN